MQLVWTSSPAIFGGHRGVAGGGAGLLGGRVPQADRVSFGRVGGVEVRVTALGPLKELCTFLRNSNCVIMLFLIIVIKQLQSVCPPLLFSSCTYTNKFCYIDMVQLMLTNSIELNLSSHFNKIA